MVEVTFFETVSFFVVGNGSIQGLENYEELQIRVSFWPVSLITLKVKIIVCRVFISSKYAHINDNHKRFEWFSVKNVKGIFS